MSLLDQLRQQAQNAQPTEEEALERRKHEIALLDSGMREALRYFKELCDYLNVIKPDVRRAFNIARGSRLEGLSQRDYGLVDRRIQIDHKDHLSEITFRMRLEGSDPGMVEREGREHVERMRDDFRLLGIDYDEEAVRNERGMTTKVVFKIKPAVGAFVQLKGDYESSRVRITMRNLETLGLVNLEVTAEKLEKQLFEEIAKLVLGQPHQLMRIASPGSLG